MVILAKSISNYLDRNYKSETFIKTSGAKLKARPNPAMPRRGPTFRRDLPKIEISQTEQLLCPHLPTTPLRSGYAMQSSKCDRLLLAAWGVCTSHLGTCEAAR